MSQPPIPEHLPGEPRRDPPGLPVFLLHLLARLLGFSLYVSLTWWFWPLFWIGCLAYGRPPNVPTPGQVRYYLSQIWTRTAPPPGIPLRDRVWLTWCVVYKVTVTPLWGLAWMLDEVLYGDELDATPIVAPLIQISAARSGSTQMSRYLEEDPHIVAPAAIQFMFPYRWLWIVAARTVGRWKTPEEWTALVESNLPPEWVERHEGDLFRTDTFEAIFYLSHLNHMASSMGPDLMAEEFTFARPTPMNRQLWDTAFIALFDRIGRKTLLHAAPGPEGQPRRLFIKGHFIYAAEALAARYPDGRFLTNIREPAKRFQSAINFLRANPREMVMGYIPWPWLTAAILRTESEYCEVEQAWFTKPEGPIRCVIRFDDYAKDLEGAMSTVYRVCLDTDTLPPHVPRTHPPRNRTTYLLNRSLEDLGLDPEAINADLNDYVRWCRGEGLAGGEMNGGSGS